MMGWLKHLRERWDNWSGDRDMELAIRKHLTLSGYFGSTAKIHRLRLIAVQRPGWLQVFRFETDVRVAVETSDDAPDPEAVYQTLFGLVRDDIRNKTSDICVFASERERIDLFTEWSEGLICLRGAYGLTK